MFTIEDNIPIPKGCHYSELTIELMGAMRKMECGQSFLVKSDAVQLKNSTFSNRFTRVKNEIARESDDLKRFLSHKVDGGVRVWRIR